MLFGYQCFHYESGASEDRSAAARRNPQGFFEAPAGGAIEPRETAFDVGRSRSSSCAARRGLFERA